MGKLNSKKRKIENELFFSQSNEKVAKGFYKLKKIAKEENQTEWAEQADEPIDFFCECADENCKRRVKLRPSEYLKLRKNKKQFIIFPGHDVPNIERKVKSTSQFQIVEKYNVPNDAVASLKPTDATNS